MGPTPPLPAAEAAAPPAPAPPPVAAGGVDPRPDVPVGTLLGAPARGPVPAAPEPATPLPPVPLATAPPGGPFSVPTPEVAPPLLEHAARRSVNSVLRRSWAPHIRTMYESRTCLRNRYHSSFRFVQHPVRYNVRSGARRCRGQARRRRRPEPRQEQPRQHHACLRCDPRLPAAFLRCMRRRSSHQRQGAASRDAGRRAEAAYPAGSNQPQAVVVS